MEMIREDQNGTFWREAEDGKFYQVDSSDSQRGLKAVGQSTPQQIADTRRDIQQKQLADRTSYEEEVYKRGPSAYARMQEAKGLPFWEKAKVIMGRETDKLLAGAGDVNDFLDSVTPDNSAIDAVFPLPSLIRDQYRQSQGSPEERTLNREKEQSELDTTYKEFDENKGAASLAGAVPYLLSGVTAGPIATKVGQKVVEGAVKGVQKGVNSGKGLFTQGVEKVASTPGAFQRLGQKAKEEWTDPMHLRSLAKSNRPKNKVPWREGFLGDVLGGGTLGAMEGGLHYDNNIIDGTIAGVGGTTAGRFLRPYLSKRPDSYSSADQKIIKDAELEGMQFFPGGKTGHKGDQSFESGLRSSKTWGEPLAVIDRNNAVVMNRAAYNAMGVPKGQVDQMTPEALLKHINGLKSEYDTVTNSSTGRFSSDSIDRLRNGSNSYINDFSEAGVKAKEVLDSRIKDIMSRVHNTRDQMTGRFRPATFTGKDFQSMDQSIKKELDKLYTDGDMVAHDALKKVQTELNDAMDNGISYGGKVSSAEWKDLNERYAMSRLLIDKGMDSTGKFDAQQFGTHLMSKDAYRTLTGQGGRIKPLQKLIKANQLSRGEAGSDMTGTGFQDHSGKMSHSQGFLTEGLGRMLPLMDQAYLSLYKRGWPAQKGLLGMSSKGGIWDPVTLSRAQAQGSQQHPYMVEKARDIKRATGKAVDEGIMWTDEKLDELDKFRKSLF